MTAQTSSKKLQLSDELLDGIRDLAEEAKCDPEDLVFDMLERERNLRAIREGREAYERGDYITGEEFEKHLDKQRERLLKLKQERA